MTWSLMTQVLLLECTKNVKVKVSFPLLEFSGQFLHFVWRTCTHFTLSERMKARTRTLKQLLNISILFEILSFFFILFFLCFLFLYAMYIALNGLYPELHPTTFEYCRIQLYYVMRRSNLTWQRQTIYCALNYEGNRNVSEDIHLF